MTRRLRARRLTLLLVIGGLALFLMDRAAKGLIVETRVTDPQALLALGSHEWDRLPALADEARRWPAAVVFLTQPAVPTVHNCHDCPNRVQRLAERGVERSRVVLLPHRVSNTRDEALAAKEECARRGIQRLQVISSPYHTLRSRRVFERTFAGTGISVGVIPATAYSPARPDRWWMKAYDRAYVRYEWAALIYDAARPGGPLRN